MSILDEIAGKTKSRVAEAKKTAPFDQVKKKAVALAVKEGSREESERFPFEKAISAPGLSFICEVKKASPSKGIIADDFPYLRIALDYESAGASAISVLTEPDYFLGNDQYLKEISSTVAIPTLRKDFVIDPYQIYEAKILGAKAVLLICALLDGQTLAEYIKTADEIGLSSLVEIHDEAEAEQAVKAGAKIIGINNRDLKTFNVDLAVTARLRSLIPAGILTVAESGIKSPEDTCAVNSLGVDAVLVGESLMRAKDKRQFLAKLKGAGSRESGVPTKIKICGLFREQDIDYVNEAKPDYVGFVFAESKRKVSPAFAVQLRRRLSGEIIPVGVFVNAPVADIVALYNDNVIAIAQLHGTEDGEYITRLKHASGSGGKKPVEVIKTIQINEKKAPNSLLPSFSAKSIDYYLIDSGEGSGKTFNWELLNSKGMTALKAEKPWFLAGGIGLDNIERAMRFNPCAIDVSSGAETDGLKDFSKIVQLVSKVRGYAKEEK